MPTQSNVKVCTHIMVTGVRCGSPALRGEQFCYFHQRMLRTVKGPADPRVHHVALLENEETLRYGIFAAEARPAAPGTEHARDCISEIYHQWLR